MDEVWLLSVILSLFALILIALSLKQKEKAAPESISKASVSTASSYSSYGGKKLEVDEDEVEKMMERLNKLLYEAEPKRKEAPQERKKLVIEEKAEEVPRHRTDSHNTDETQESVGRVPGHTQPAYQPSHHIMQKRSAPAPVENIMDEIEQAVQETVEPDYYARRRQERAAARPKQWTETDNL